MSEINTGGPAFPRSGRVSSVGLVVEEPQRGMTLRDYFAAKAMQADLVDGVHESDFALTAARAYKMADAMLKARQA